MSGDVRVYTEEFLRSIDVHEILPQQDPFVMIGNLVHFELVSSVTETKIEESCIFVDNGKMSAAGLFENMAQTCAARIGFYSKYVLHNNEIKIGVIGSIRNYVVHRLPVIGSLIVTKVNVVEEVFGMTLAEAEIRCQGEVIATAEVRLAIAGA